MSILSDAQIEALCVLPRSRMVTPPDPNQAVALPGGGFATTTMWSDRTPYELEYTEEEREAFEPMIYPFSSELVRFVSDGFEVVATSADGGMDVSRNGRKIISRGLTSYGYDVALSSTKGIKLFTNINSAIVDPKKLDVRALGDAEIHTDVDGAKYFLMPPHSYALGATMEYFKMPSDVVAICVGKSTYARAGCGVNVTPIEPGFHGEVVIELVNHISLPMKVYLDEGISQFMFFQGDEPCRTSYAARGGKYQGQTGITLPRA